MFAQAASRLSGADKCARNGRTFDQLQYSALLYDPIRVSSIQPYFLLISGARKMHRSNPKGLRGPCLRECLASRDGDSTWGSGFAPEANVEIGSLEPRDDVRKLR